MFLHRGLTTTVNEIIFFPLLFFFFLEFIQQKTKVNFVLF